jgi:hypothetical protein
LPLLFSPSLYWFCTLPFTFIFSSICIFVRCCLRFAPNTLPFPAALSQFLACIPLSSFPTLVFALLAYCFLYLLYTRSSLPHFSF